MFQHQADELKKRSDYQEAITTDLNSRIKVIVDKRNLGTWFYRELVDPEIELWRERNHIVGLDDDGHAAKARAAANAKVAQGLAGERLAELETQKAVFASFDSQLTPLIEDLRILQKSSELGEPLKLLELRKMAHRYGVHIGPREVRD